MRERDVNDEELERLLFASSPYSQSGSDPTVRLGDLSPTDETSGLARATHVARRRRRPASLAWVAPVVAVVAIGLIVVIAVRPIDLLRGPSAGGEPTADQTQFPVEPLSTLAATPLPRGVIPQGVIGTGELSSADGSTSGSVEILRSGDTLQLRVSDLQTTHESLIIGASLYDRGDDLCLDGGVYEISGDLGVSTTMTADLALSAVPSNDPTLFDEVVLRVGSPTAEDSTCIYTAAARASIEWLIDPLRPALADVVDSGPRPGARGVVETLETGQRIYRVAPNDLLDDVAERFGLSRDDLFYLNDARAPSPRDPMLYIDEELNLDIAFR